MILFWMILLTSLILHPSITLQSSEIPSSALIEENSPKYHGFYEKGEIPFDANHFTEYSAVEFSTEHRASFLPKISADDVILRVFEFVDDFHPFVKFIFRSKRLFKLLTQHFMLRFHAFNPKLFWLLPSRTRLRFALSFLRGFETRFPGLKGNVDLTCEDVISLTFLLLHERNPLFISRSDLAFLHALSPFNSQKYDSFSSSASIWKITILSKAIKNDALFAIEAACRITSSEAPVDWIFELLTHKLGLQETTWNKEIPISIVQLIRRILDMFPDKLHLRVLLLKSVEHSTISTFSAFLSSWTDPLSSLTAGQIQNDHILVLIARNRLSCSVILERPDLDLETVSLALDECRKVGNWRMAIELISKYPRHTFANHFETQLIEAIQSILNSPHALQVADLNLAEQVHVPLALILASFGFPDQKFLTIFRRLIRGHVTSEILDILLRKHNNDYYDQAARTLDKKCVIS